MYLFFFSFSVTLNTFYNWKKSSKGQQPGAFLPRRQCMDTHSTESIVCMSRHIDFQIDNINIQSGVITKA